MRQSRRTHSPQFKVSGLWIRLLGRELRRIPGQCGWCPRHSAQLLHQAKQAPVVPAFNDLATSNAEDVHADITRSHYH